MIQSLASLIAALPKRCKESESTPVYSRFQWYEFDLIQREIENDVLLIVKQIKDGRRKSEWVIGTKLTDNPTEMLRELGNSLIKIANKIEVEK